MSNSSLYDGLGGEDKMRPIATDLLALDYALRGEIVRV